MTPYLPDYIAQLRQSGKPIQQALPPQNLSSDYGILDVFHTIKEIKEIIENVKKTYEAFHQIKNLLKKNGSVEWTLPNGLGYKGEIRDGVYHGKGILTIPPRTCYEGDFCYGNFHGKGVLTLSNGDRYEGEFHKGMFHGQGIYTCADGMRYEGEYKDGQSHGRGKTTWTNGGYYEGEYQYDKRHGEGIFVYPDGSVLYGIWDNNDLIERYSINDENSQDESLLAKVFLRLFHTIIIVRRKHCYGILALTFSPDGQMLVSTSMDTTVRFWNVSKNKLSLKRTLGVSTNALAYSPNGENFISGNLTIVSLWKTNKAKPLYAIERHHFGYINCVSYNPNGNMFASASDDFTVKVWKIDKDHFSLLHTLHGHKSLATSVAYNHDGSILFSAGYDKTIKLWDVRTGNLLHSQQVEYKVSSLAYDPNKNILASASDETPIIKLWIIKRTTLKLQTVLQKHENWIYSIVYSPDGSILASASKDGTIRFWKSDTGNLLYTLKCPKVGHIAYHPNGYILASGDTEGNINLWDLRSLFMTK